MVHNRIKPSADADNNCCPISIRINSIDISIYILNRMYTLHINELHYISMAYSFINYIMYIYIQSIIYDIILVNNLFTFINIFQS